MAIAVSARTHIEGFPGNRELITATITLDTSYPTGGSTGIAAALGFTSVQYLDVLQSKGYTHEYLPGTDALRTYQSAAAGNPMTEVANATNLSAVTVNVAAIGTTS